MNSAQRTARDADLAITLKRAAINGEESRGIAIAKKLFTSNPEWIHRDANPEEIEVRRFAHEILDEFLRGVVFADHFPGEAWQQLSLPARDSFANPVLIANARWLRLFGSTRPDQGLEELTPESLKSLTFEQQAKALGRYCSVNDGAREIDYAAIMDALDPTLRPSFAHWALCVFAASPGNLSEGRAAEHQASLVASFTARHAENFTELAGSTMFMNMPYSLCYRDGIDIQKLALIANGEITRRMLDEFGMPSLDPSAGALSQGIAKGGDLILCPNWTEEHVAYRCMADVTEGMRSDQMRVVMIHEPSVTRTPAASWAQQTVDFQLPGQRHFLAEIGGAAEQIKRAELDFLFYPEVSPNNATVIFATQRLARVQAAGYGYPVTTGSAHMDYFIGGSEVEGDGSEYTEQLILLPGLGVSTTAPPLPPAPRERGLIEDDIKLATITSSQKLTQPLMQAWEAILGSRPEASMDLFPALSHAQATALLPALSANLDKAKINLQLVVPRSQILNTLENADIYLDSFPYGGFNSLVEVLCSGCPVVTLEGPQARHRFGAAMLRRLGLPSFLIAKSPKQFIEAAQKLIDDPGLRLAIREQIGSRANVIEALAEPHIAEHFAAAVELMRTRGPLIGKPGPPLHITAQGELRNCA